MRVHVDADGEVWWCANDVTNALGYSNGRDAVAKHVDSDERRSVAISYAPSGKNQGTPIERETTFISESGVYALVVRSNKPEAKAWWKRIRSEVLPAIRKTGMYIAPIGTPPRISAGRIPGPPSGLRVASLNAAGAPGEARGRPLAPRRYRGASEVPDGRGWRC